MNSDQYKLICYAIGQIRFDEETGEFYIDPTVFPDVTGPLRFKTRDEAKAFIINKILMGDNT